MYHLFAFALAVLTLALPCGALAQSSAENDLRIIQGPALLSVARGHTPYGTYCFGEVPFKPYLQTLCTPRGVNILRDAPEDHRHHHGLMFALAVDGVNFWAEDPGSQPGRQVSRGFESNVDVLPGGRSAAVLRQKLDWLKSDSDEKPLLSETRTVRAYLGPGLEASLLEWRSELAPAAGKKSVVLSGSHYFGLGMRFVSPMDRGGKFIFAADQPGEVIRGKERVTSSKWVAYSSTAEAGRPVTVALFDHPENLRHPAAMFTMPEPFSYLSATLELFRRPLTLEAERPLTLRYGVAVWDGEVEREAIELQYALWQKLETAAQQPQ